MRYKHGVVITCNISTAASNVIPVFRAMRLQRARGQLLRKFSWCCSCCQGLGLGIIAFHTWRWLYYNASQMIAMVHPEIIRLIHTSQCHGQLWFLEIHCHKVYCNKTVRESYYSLAHYLGAHLVYSMNDAHRHDGCRCLGSRRRAFRLYQPIVWLDCYHDVTWTILHERNTDHRNHLCQRAVS